MRLARGDDLSIAQWAFMRFNKRPIQLNCAFAIVDGSDTLCGAVLFSGFNGADVEVHYYGPRTLSRQILKQIGAVVLDGFKAQRVTVKTRNEGLTRGLDKLGVRHECDLANYYGPGADDTAHQYVIPRRQIEAFCKRA